MAIPDDVKKQALEAAQGMNEMNEMKGWPAATPATQEVETGSPQTPNYQPDYGQTMKDTPQWPQAKEPEPASSTPDRETEPDLDR